MSARRVPVLRGVELIPDRPAAGLHHLVDGMVSLLDAAEDLQRLLLLRRARHRQRPFGVEQRAAGRQHDRRLPFRAEQIDAHVDLRGIDETARAELVVGKPFTIRLQRRVVVHAGGEVSPMRRRQRFLRRRLEFQDVDGLSGIGDDEVLRGLRCGGLAEGRGPAEAGPHVQRTGREELQKCPARSSSAVTRFASDLGASLGVWHDSAPRASAPIRPASGGSGRTAGTASSGSSAWDRSGSP